MGSFGMLLNMHVQYWHCCVTLKIKNEVAYWPIHKGSKPAPGNNEQLESDILSVIS